MYMSEHNGGKGKFRVLTNIRIRFYNVLFLLFPPLFLLRLHTSSSVDSDIDNNVTPVRDIRPSRSGVY